MSHRHDHEAAALTPAHLVNEITSTTPGTCAQLTGRSAAAVLVLAAHEAALQALVSTGDIVGWREFVIQAFQSRSCETGYLPASLWGELASESNEHQDIIRTMYVRWGLALSQSFERVHSNEPVLRLPDVSMFGLAASTVLHGGFGLSAIHGDVRPLEEALEIMLQV